MFFFLFFRSSQCIELYSLKKSKWWTFCSVYSGISALAPLGNVCTSGCGNGPQPYAPLACPAPHLAWRWLAALLLFPFSSFPFQQPPHSSNCLSIQDLPSPTACTLPVSFFSIILLLARSAQLLLYGWNEISEPQTTGSHLHKRITWSQGVGRREGIYLRL